MTGFHMKGNTGLKCGGMFMTFSLFLENTAIACFYLQLIDS